MRAYISRDRDLGLNCLDTFRGLWTALSREFYRAKYVWESILLSESSGVIGYSSLIARLTPAKLNQR